MGADLHVHSCFSDGTLTPEQLIDLALEKGIKTLAIADHETVTASIRAREIADKKGVELVPALELSSYESKAEMHILGYFIDLEDEKLLKKMAEISSRREIRVKQIVELLNRQDIRIDYHDVKKVAGQGYIGRPHIARALLNLGYIDEISQAFTDKYIGNGSPAYIQKYKMKPAEAISLINQAGGIAVVAHPFFVKQRAPLQKKDIAVLKAKGLQGIEVFHSKHNQEWTQIYLKIASQLDLLITGGSDYHGSNSPDIKLGDIILANRYLEKLKSASRS